MSLKTDFFDGATGLHQQEDAAFAAGQAFVTSNAAALSTDLKNQAAAGMTKFVLSYTATMSSAILRGNKGNNLILKSYLAGITDGLASQALYSFEVIPSLNVADNINTMVDLSFNFQTV
jgi:hypothetical protein